MEIRSFRNCDPPALARLWNRLPALRGRAREVSPATLEAIVFSKPYFDPLGLHVLEDAGTLLGFSHAGFGPNQDFSALCTEMGVTCAIGVDPIVDDIGMSRQLLYAGENYLLTRGAKLLYGGQVAPLNPFYLGMYGGSEHPGVLVSDSAQLELYQASGYEEADRVLILQSQLPARSILDRKQMQVKRKYRVDRVESIGSLNWWNVCTAPYHDEVYFQLFAGGGGPALGSITCWLVEPLTHTWGNVTVGLIQVRVHESLRRQGLGTFMMSEALRHLSASGIQRAEVQIMQRNSAALGLYQKIGFQVIEQGVVFRKRVSVA